MYETRRDNEPHAVGQVVAVLPLGWREQQRVVQRKLEKEEMGARARTRLSQADGPKWLNTRGILQRETSFSRARHLAAPVFYGGGSSSSGACWGTGMGE
jgi:hypothetical protein